MTTTLERIGFMQGRLSALVDGKIEAFPWDEWRDEFPRAKALGLTRMEWTIDQERLRENPLATETGQQEILALSQQTGVRIPSLTGDCFMQAPFWKVDAVVRDALVADLDLLIAACSRVGIEFVVIPLVDNGKIERESESDTLKRVLLARSGQLTRRNVKIVFESDLPPRDLARFMEAFPPDVFGINYDSGNSASLGCDSDEEIAAYAPRILNVHVKDRIRGGTWCRSAPATRTSPRRSG